MAHKATLDVFGDILEIEWTGSVWVSPVNGQQHSSRREAMRAEVAHYLMACGELVTYSDIGEYESLLDNIDEASA